MLDSLQKRGKLDEKDPGKMPGVPEPRGKHNRGSSSVCGSGKRGRRLRAGCDVRRNLVARWNHRTTDQFASSSGRSVEAAKC